MASTKSEAAEWDREVGNPQWMVSQLRTCRVPRTNAGRRKLRLFACGCCRVAWDILPDDRLRDTIETAERFAEGRATKKELAAAQAAAAGMTMFPGRYWRKSTSTEVRTAIDMAIEVAHAGAHDAAYGMTATGLKLAGQVPAAAADEYMCRLIRCVFGNPYRPVAVACPARSSTVTDLAHGIYEERAFDRLPILADALEEAGCDCAELLAHCRGAGPHTRGCWALDWALGKK